MGLRSHLVPDSKGAKICDEVETSIGEAAKELRTFSYLLYPPTLSDNGLHQAIRQYLEGYADRSGVIAKYRGNAKVDKLSVATQRSLLRIAKEVLANAHRHASASQVVLDLRCIAGRLHITATDNGRRLDIYQLDEHALSQQELGVRGIEALARQLGGEVRTKTRPSGTRVHISVPLRWGG
jgi:signal transduction histidine kinase